jgi:hypothetical protein
MCLIFEAILFQYNEHSAILQKNSQRKLHKVNFTKSKRFDNTLF